MKEPIPAKTFMDLKVWQDAHAFTLSVYKTTASFPSHELYGLTSQFRRAAVSVPANIAEGFKKQGVADKLRFYNIAHGSLEECRYYCILAEDLGYSSTKSFLPDLDVISRKLNKYCSTIRNSNS